MSWYGKLNAFTMAWPYNKERGKERKEPGELGRQKETQKARLVLETGKVRMQLRRLLLGNTLLSLGTANSKSGFSDRFITCSKI